MIPGIFLGSVGEAESLTKTREDSDFEAKGI